MDPVLGYLDPGTGSVILQALLGGLAGLAVALKLFGRRILDFFRIGRSDSKKTTDPAPDPDAG
jgi:hypothetical protein